MTNLSNAHFEHSHILGYYDHFSEPQIYPRPSSEVTLESVTMHELAHKWLSERSTTGLMIKLMIRAYHLMKSDSHSTERDLAALIGNINKCTNIIRGLHEGFATYNEFLSNEGNLTSQNYHKEKLNKRSRIYSENFMKAALIESIFSREYLAGASSEFCKYIWRWTLLDISRFALNVPIPQNYDIKSFSNSLEINNPTKRWYQVLESLATNESLRIRLIAKTKTMIKTWNTKYKRLYSSDGKFQGIGYSDNIEQSLSELFPEMEYMNLSNAPRIAGIRFDSDDSTEDAKDYFVRRYCTELHIAPSDIIPVFQDVSKEDLIEAFFHLNKSNAGCYIRIVLGNSKSVLEPQIGPSKQDKIRISRDQCALFAHGADFQNFENSKRLWQYYGAGNAFVLPKDLICELLESLSWLDAVVVIEVPFEDNDLTWILELKSVKTPLYVVPSPCGSLKSIVRFFQEGNCKIDMKLLVMDNWTHFDGAGTNQLKLLWLILNDGEISIFNFASDIILNGLSEWTAIVGVPKNLTFLKTDGFERVIVSDSSNRWKPSEDSKILLAPANADVATSHFLDMGW